MKYEKMSSAAKDRASKMNKDEKGRFTKVNIKPASPPVTPPAANVNYSTQFVTVPNPINDIFWNPDEAFNSNQENASRMIADMAIFSALQERQLATASLPWSIVPQDQDSPEQQFAADEIEDIIKSFLPDLPDFLRNLLDAIWNGRSAAYLHYDWDFSEDRRRMVPKGWTPVHGDSLLFGTDGRLGYRVGSGPTPVPSIISIQGRGVLVDLEPTEVELPNGEYYLAPAERDAWVVHHFQKSAGEFRLFQSAASIFGIGLRSRVYAIWLLKQSALQFAMQGAEKFGSGWIIGYFDGSNPASATAVRDSLEKQVGSCIQMFPRFAAGEQAIEGLEVISPPSGFDQLLKIIEYYDNQLRQTICGQALTSEKGSTGLGSNLASVHETTFGRLIRYDSMTLQETLSDQLVKVLQEFNGFGDLPPLKFEFSFDLGNAKEKLEKAKLLYDMGIPVSHSELLQAAGFAVAQASDITTNNKGNIDTSALADKQGDLEGKDTERLTENFF